LRGAKQSGGCAKQSGVFMHHNLYPKNRVSSILNHISFNVRLLNEK
jgi:hypothetical protein